MDRWERLRGKRRKLGHRGGKEGKGTWERRKGLYVGEREVIWVDEEKGCNLPEIGGFNIHAVRL